MGAVEASQNLQYTPNFFVEDPSPTVNEDELASKKALYLSRIILALEELVKSTTNVNMLRFICSEIEDRFFQLLYFDAPFQGSPPVSIPIQLLVPPINYKYILQVDVAPASPRADATSPRKAGGRSTKPFGFLRKTGGA